jgi:hypothetical protein
MNILLNVFIYKYNCNKTDEFCPSFNLLRTKRRKTCKQIIKSSKSPSKLITKLSKLTIGKIINKGTSHIPLPNKPICIKYNKNKTQKSRKFSNKQTRRIRRNKSIINNNTNFFQIL